MIAQQVMEHSGILDRITALKCLAVAGAGEADLLWRNGIFAKFLAVAYLADTRDVFNDRLLA